MIRITRQTDYAARVLLHLARMDAKASASIADISRHWRMPAPFVRRLVAQLVRAGILKTARGSNGGVQLGRPAAQLSLLDLVEAMESPISLNHCERLPDNCLFHRKCPVRDAWAGASAALAGHLAAVHFDALAAAGSGSAPHARRTVQPPRRPARRHSEQ